MAVSEILTYPDPRLRQQCVPVKEITKEIRKILDDMAETMYAAQGIGLAAIQVGIFQRLIVLDVKDEPNDDELHDEVQSSSSRLYKIVNPAFTHKEGTTQFEEGCLSIPGIRDVITRSTQVTLTGQDEFGKPLILEASGLLAICLQHEIDHLNGILFIDHLSRVKQELIKAKYKKQLSQK